jgi:hypothetical protein
MLTQEELKRLLHYDPETGVFTWNVKRSNKVKIFSVAGSTQTMSHNKKTYIRIKIHNKKYFAHRLAHLYITGYWPEDQIDHIDGNGINNKWCNLRSVNISENMRNYKKPITNTSGICGVSWDSSAMKWSSYIHVNNKQIKLGRFSNMLDASCARKSAEIKYGFHKNHGSDRSL